MKWPSTDVSERLGVTYPILQAPLSGDVTTPALVAAVSNAGGLGTLDAAGLDPDAIRRSVRAIRELTDKPFAASLAVPQPMTEDAERILRANELLGRFRERFALPQPEPLAAYAPNYTEQLGALFEESVRVIHFLYGVPGADELELLKQQGATVIGSATHLLEAIVLEESGVDLIVAQGSEAGGHRATFIGGAQQGLVGTMALVPLFADRLRVPVVACGGIYDGRGVVAALALGAGGAQIGTAFLACPESGAHPAFKERLADATEVSTALSRSFTGKPARGLTNRLSRELAEVDEFLPGYPIQNALTAELRRAAAERSDVDYLPLWAGQGCSGCSAEPVAALFEHWIEQVNALLLTRRRIAGTVRV